MWMPPEFGLIFGVVGFEFYGLLERFLGLFVLD